MKNFDKLSYVGEGRDRIVYRHGKFVIKIPRNDKGIFSNYREAKISIEHGRWRNKIVKDKNGYIHFARCKLVGVILIMEYVETGYKYKDLPRWAGWIDCGQVGKAKDGMFVAYDYGF